MKRYLLVGLTLASHYRSRSAGRRAEESSGRREGLPALGRTAPAPRLPRTGILPVAGPGEYRPVRSHHRRGRRDPRDARHSQVRPDHRRGRPPRSGVQVHQGPAGSPLRVSSARDTATSRSTARTTPRPTGFPTWKEMLGGVFSHFGLPDGKTKKGSFTVKIVDSSSPITQGIKDFPIKDELYYQLQMMPDVQPLATIEYQGTAWPVAWTRTFGKGRVFHTTMGHRDFGPNKEDPLRDPNLVAPGRPGRRMGGRGSRDAEGLNTSLGRGRHDLRPESDHSQGGFDRDGPARTLPGRPIAPAGHSWERRRRRAYSRASPSSPVTSWAERDSSRRANRSTWPASAPGAWAAATSPRSAASEPTSSPCATLMKSGPPARSRRSPRPGNTRTSARCSTRSATGSTRSPSARRTTSTPWPPWRRSGRGSTSTARSR